MKLITLWTVFLLINHYLGKNTKLIRVSPYVQKFTNRLKLTCNWYFAGNLSIVISL